VGTVSKAHTAGEGGRLEIVGLTKRFGRGRHAVTAVHGATIAVPKGARFGLVGESGSGKSTLARLVAGLSSPDAGSIRFAGTDLQHMPRLKRLRRVQLVFQDPMTALNPRHTVSRTLSIPLLRLGGCGRRALPGRLRDLVERVGLDAALLDRFPHELSGGQAQRVGIARALAADPDLLILDEALSGLDVSVQARVLALLEDLQSTSGLTYLFITHDLAVVDAFCDTVAVMKDGAIVEEGACQAVLSSPQHAYTRQLMDSVPRLPG
jgi:peptide/nickel transport system ATP-binding protein